MTTVTSQGDSGRTRLLSNRWLPPLSLLFLLALLFTEPILGWTVVIPDRIEFFQQWYPYRLYIKSAWLQGEFPLWCHNLLCGFPLGAFPHASAFYPLNAFFAWFDYPRATTLCNVFDV